MTNLLDKAIEAHGGMDAPSHSTAQVFYFDDTLMLRRQDYNTFDLGGGEAANYASEYVTFDGITLPMRRRVYHRDANNRSIKDVVFVALYMERPQATHANQQKS